MADNLYTLEMVFIILGGVVAWVMGGLFAVVYGVGLILIWFKWNSEKKNKKKAKHLNKSSGCNK